MRGETKGFIETKSLGWAEEWIQGMRRVYDHEQTTRKKAHHDSWHSEYASLFVYVSSLHLEHMTCYRVRIVQVESFCIYIHIYNPSYYRYYI